MRSSVWGRGIAELSWEDFFMIIDVHCHIDQLTIEEQERELTKHCVVGVAGNYQSGESLLLLQKQYPNNVKVCLGIHPEGPDSFHEYDIVEAQIRKNRDVIVGIGEIGLPFFNLSGKNAAERAILLKNAAEIFEKFVILAAELHLPVNLHCVEDTVSQGIAILKKYNIKKALFHWFEGDVQDLKEIVQHGWNISISPDLVCNTDYRLCITTVAADIREIFTLESDGPWEYGGKRGMPSMIEETASLLAEIFHMTKQEVFDVANRNAERLFG
jgi:TatD DNase family protein